MSSLVSRAGSIARLTEEIPALRMLLPVVMTLSMLAVFVGA